jgi:site-specific recombinase XerD
MPLEMPWPEALHQQLETWLTIHRPILVACRGRSHSPAGDAVWISTDGSPMTQMALYDRIMLQTKAAFGLPLNPHLFRDCAATSIAIQDPEHVRIAASLLGHASLATTERYYNQAQSLEAARHWQDTLAELRARGHSERDPSSAEDMAR